MFRFKRTVSALALGLCLAGGASLIPDLVAPAAHAQATAEARLRSMLDLMGVPPDLIKWSGVEEAGSGFIVRGVFAEIASFNMGFTTLPLGDWEITALETDGSHITRLESRFTNISINVAELMTTGQKIAQVGGEAASMGTGLAMAAGYLQGLGYPTIDLSLGYRYAIDMDDETMEGAFDLDMKDGFKFLAEAEITGVTVQYLDWAKANLTKMFLDRSAAAMAEMQKVLEDPNGPLANYGFESFSLSFDDQGLMPKLEPGLAMPRQMVLGTNPDGSPKTEITDADVEKAAAEMAGTSGISPEKLEPVVRAIYSFLLKPDLLHLAVRFDPAIRYGEVMPPAQPGTSPAATTDWNSRVSFEASN